MGRIGKKKGILRFPDGKEMDLMNDRHRRVAELEVTGKLSRRQIGETVGLSKEQVNRILREDIPTLNYLAKLRAEYEAEAKNVRMAAEKQLMNDSLAFSRVLMEIATDTEAQTSARVSAARFGLQFAGLKLDNRDDMGVVTPHLAIRDSRADNEKKEESKAG